MGVLGEEGGDAVEIMKDEMVGDKRRHAMIWKAKDGREREREGWLFFSAFWLA